MGKPKQKESSIHYQVAQYLKLAYPSVIFRTDFSAGVKMSMGQAIKHKSLQQGRAYPDLFVAEPNGPHHGLFIELKRDGVKLFKRDGKTYVTEHIKEQAETLDTLRRKRYCAEFAIGFDEAKHILDKYLKSDTGTY